MYVIPRFWGEDDDTLYSQTLTMGSGKKKANPVRQAIIAVAMAVAVLCGGNRAHAQQETSSSGSAIPSASEHSVPFSGLSPQSVIQTSGSDDTVHFCLPDDPEQLGYGRPISAARRQGDLNVGEPRTVRMVYFLPNDRPHRSSIVDSMKAMIKQAQTFYAEQMHARGYGDATFRFETDEQGEPLVHQVDGHLPDSYYIQDTHLRVNAQIRRTFDFYANVYLIVIDNSTDRIEFHRNFWEGIGFRYGKNGGFALVTGGFDFSLLAHELGHAFGLYHNFHSDSYVMASGRTAPMRLSVCNAEFLAVHPYFNPDSPITENPSPSMRIVSPQAYPAGSDSIPVQLEVSDPEGVHQTMLLETAVSPNIARRSLEVKACRGLAGVQDGVAEFDYDGAMPSVQGRNLADPPVHFLYAQSVDMDGNAGEKSIIHAEISPQHMTTFEGHTDDVNSVSLSSDGIIASGSHDHTVRLWEASQGKQQIAILDENKGPVYSVLFSPDEKTLVSSAWNPGYAGGVIRLWGMPEGKQIGIFEAPKGSAYSVSFSPDGMMLVSGTASTIGTVELWDVAQLTHSFTFEGHPNRPVLAVSFSRDGIIASGSTNGEIKLWDVETKQHIATLRLGAYVDSMAFSPDGTIIASGLGDGTIRLLDVATKKHIALLRSGGAVFSVGFSPDGRILASGSVEATVKLWDVAKKERIATFTGHTHAVNSVSFSPDGTTLASGSRDRTVQLWDVFEWASVVPDAPVNLQAASDSETVSLSWEAPTDDRGSEITGYAYRHKETGGSFSEWTDIPDSTLGSANAGSYTITGLTNGSTYTFELRAVNMHGGGRSASVTVTLPSGPTSTESEELPSEVALLGNYPNPFNPETTIGYALPRAGKVRLVVYDMLGQEVAVLVDGLQPAGRHAVRFRGDHLPSGPYAYRLQAGDEMVVRTMILVK